jgi:hypothetical protein
MSEAMDDERTADEQLIAALREEIRRAGNDIRALRPALCALGAAPAISRLAATVYRTLCRTAASRCPVGEFSGGPAYFI